MGWRLGEREGIDGGLCRYSLLSAGGVGHIWAGGLEREGLDGGLCRYSILGAGGIGRNGDGDLEIEREIDGGLFKF